MKRYLGITVAVVVLGVSKAVVGQSEIPGWFETLARAEQTETVQIVFASDCDSEATVVVQSTPFMDSGGVPIEEPTSTEVVLAPGKNGVVTLRRYAFAVIYRLVVAVTPGKCAAPGVSRVEALVAVIDQIGQAMAVLRPDFGSGLGELVSQPNPMTMLFHRGLSDRNILAMHNGCARPVRFVLVAEEVEGENGGPEEGRIGPEELVVLDVSDRIDVEQYGRVKVRFTNLRDTAVASVCVFRDLSLSLVTVRNGATKGIQHFNTAKGFGFISNDDR